MKTQLLCTFSNKRNVINTVRDILDIYDINSGKIFIYDIVSRPGEIICSYNIIDTKKPKFLEYTISVHRKKLSNTFYTINALNQLIMELNNGVLDTKFSVEWENYTNTLILINDSILKKEKLKFKEVYNIKKPEQDNE